MARFVKLSQILDGKVEKDFGVAKIAGSSMTIPGQGSDLAQIISSIVKLPPLDERNFDSPAGVDPDIRSLAVKTELDGMYTPEGVALAEEAQKRKDARKKAEEKKEETKEEPATTPPTTE